MEGVPFSGSGFNNALKTLTGVSNSLQAECPIGLQVCDERVNRNVGGCMRVDIPWYLCCVQQLCLAFLLTHV